VLAQIDTVASRKRTSRKLRNIQRALLLSSATLAFTPTMSLAQTYTFTNTGAIQNWVVPKSGFYSVTAIGAQGASAAPGFSGGRGAQVTDTFKFNSGSLYQIAVGGAGTQDGCNGGGGGGTFFVDSANNPILVAGGGGGTRVSVLQNGTDASVTRFGTTASGSQQTYTPAAKSTDLGLGGIVSSGSWGSGGAGFFGDGASDVPFGSPTSGGRSWANGMKGGTGSAAGGFGGGGAGNGSCGGGGGGGYSGGDGGRVAGGGGSFASDATAVFLAGVGLGDGELLITFLRQLALLGLLPANAPINPTNVAAAIDRFTNAGGNLPAGFQNLFNLTPQQLSAALTQASGETATGIQQTTFDAMNLFMGVMTDPFMGDRGSAMGVGAIGYASEGGANAYAMFTKARPPVATFEPRWSVWAAGYGGSQTTDGNTALGSNTTTSSVYGAVIGADYRISPFTVAGFALAGGGTNFGVANGGSGSSDLFQAGAFIRHTVGPAYISAALAYGWQAITTDRIVTIAGLDQLHAQFNANAFSGRLEGGYRFVAPWVGGIGITPYAAAQFTTFDLPAYAEQATSGSNAFALSYNAKDVTDPRSELGIRADKSFAMTDGILTLRGRLAWAHDYDPSRSIAATFQTLPGASFVVNGAAQASDSALVTASVEKKWLNGWSAAATFEGEFSDVTRSYAGKGVVRYTW
jgi:uncharacterized protein YhjY with autotransporter beta-barrel domain